MFALSARVGHPEFLTRGKPGDPHHSTLRYARRAHTKQRVIYVRCTSVSSSSGPLMAARALSTSCFAVGVWFIGALSGEPLAIQFGCARIVTVSVDLSCACCVGSDPVKGWKALTCLAFGVGKGTRIHLSGSSRCPIGTSVRHSCSTLWRSAEDGWTSDRRR